MASLLETGGHAGDEGNFEALYRTYKSEVQRLASYLLRNAADAEDASQTVFLNVLRALRQGVRPTEPRAWLLSITRNVCFSSRRAVACRPSEVEFDVETVSQAAEDRGPSSDEIVGALVRMQANQRTALILRDFRGASRSEIAGLLKMSTAGVEALLTRARIAFREELEAGEQPFDCDETKALVEQQLDGIITVSERHTLRTHLRHCSPCSTLARAVRSSRGKLAGLLLWPSGLISRLVAAFSQAPTAVHVAAALTS
ncbi:MAG TPA: sigma-70 family RNA polymerase sigma factor, partial [Gaiellaceae bacterium]|nr:sigma-70 family RNA polymerase sigma factor [Gaiellaceae bacterium]